jgi:hypothetical protein
MSERWVQKLALLDRLEPPADLEQRAGTADQSVNATPTRRRRRLRLVAAAGVVIAVLAAAVTLSRDSSRDSSSPGPRRTIEYPEFASRNLPYQPGNGFPIPLGGIGLPTGGYGPPKPPPPPQIRGASASSPTDAWAVGGFDRAVA